MIRVNIVSRDIYNITCDGIIIARNVTEEQCNLILDTLKNINQITKVFTISYE